MTDVPYQYVKKNGLVIDVLLNSVVMTTLPGNRQPVRASRYHRQEAGGEA